MINNGGDSDSDYGEENNWNSFSLSSKQKKVSFGLLLRYLL